MQHGFRPIPTNLLPGLLTGPLAGLLAVAVCANVSAQSPRPSETSQPTEIDSANDPRQESLTKDSTESLATLKLNSESRVGDTGIGDRLQTFAIIQAFADHQYLVSEGQHAATAVFLFRRFDFSTLPFGTRVPAPLQFQITGKHSFTEPTTGIRKTALIVEPLDDQPVKAESTKHVSEPGNESERVTANKVPYDASPTTDSNQITTANLDASRPRFVVRNWIQLAEYQNIRGRLVGVGDDVVWVRVGNGKTLRVGLSSLDPRDREHALAKKQAILDYRKTSKLK